MIDLMTERKRDRETKRQRINDGINQLLKDQSSGCNAILNSFPITFS